MALPAHDQFTAPDDTALTDYSANWTLCSGNFSIYLNSVRCSSINDECGAGWNADPFDDDQYAQGTIVAMQPYFITGIGIRLDILTPSANYYCFYGDHEWSQLAKVIDGEWITLGDEGPGFQANDAIRMEAEGTTIRGLINGILVCEATDNALSSGATGLSGYSTTYGTRLDDWEGGNLVGGGAVARSFVVIIG